MSLEILVPAGSYENLVAAVNNGADAIYLGGKQFSARANATNFSNEEIEKGVRYAHTRGKKVYVAINTLVEDDNFSNAYDFARFCYQIGVDAVIVQDLGVFSMLKESFPDLKINASTQMTIHNLKGVKAAEKLGFSRIVLSRELSKDEIGNICKNTDAEIEIFAHGALCMCYSGQCLMSSFIGARSGNRGACAQPCRLPYTLLDGNGKTICENKYILSLKDLCLLDDIGEIEKLGVKSLKIEGRMKNTEYVAMTSYLYDKYRNGERVQKEDIDDLKSVFSRNGFTKGYFENSTGRHMLNFSQNNDDVYKNITEKAKIRAEALCKNQGKKILLTAHFDAHIGKKCVLTLWDLEGHCAVVQSDALVEKAINVPLTEERISEQIKKTGGTPFEVGEIAFETDEDISLPVKEINNLRRRAFEEIENQRCEVFGRDNAKEFSFEIIKNNPKMEFTASAMTYEQAKALEQTNAKRIYIPKGIYENHRNEFSSERFFVTLPAIERNGKEAQGYERICTSNFSQILDNGIKHAGFRMNIFNSPAVKYLKNLGFSSVCLSPEMNLNQISAISKDLPLEVVSYGYLPVMTVQNCVVNSAFEKCNCENGRYFLKDRKGYLFPVIADKESCTNVILNSKPIFMADKMADIKKSGISYAMLNFTMETPKQVKEIFSLYEKGEKADFDFTRGHFLRGV